MNHRFCGISVHSKCELQQVITLLVNITYFTWYSGMQWPLKCDYSFFAHLVLKLWLEILHGFLFIALDVRVTWNSVCASEHTLCEFPWWWISLLDMWRQKKGQLRILLLIDFSWTIFMVQCFCGCTLLSYFTTLFIQFGTRFWIDLATTAPMALSGPVQDRMLTDGSVIKSGGQITFPGSCLLCRRQHDFWVEETILWAEKILWEQTV